MDRKSRTLILLVLSGLLAAAATSSASAATISPASADFGRVLIDHKTPVRTFTVTLGGEAMYPLEPNDFGGFVTGFTGLDFSEVQSDSPGECHAVSALTPSHPSCTVSVVFSPTDPGPQRGIAFGNGLMPDTIAPLTGIGIIPRKSLYCRKGPNGRYISHKKLTRWCQK